MVVAVATVVLALAAAPVAQAELYHPRQQWLRDSTAGLFMHWGMFTTPVHFDCAEWEQAVTDGGWNADYWVDEARKLHTQYIVLATFHSRLGYARPWPSKIPGSCATARDFLGELIAARETFGRQEDSSRIKDYTVSVIDVRRTRHVRLTIHSTWGSPTIPAFYNKLAIDEMYVIRRHVR